MVTKSIRLSEEEAAAVHAYVDVTGEVEANVLRRAMLRGLQELRLEQAIITYLRSKDSHEAAKVAGLSRARFLDTLSDYGVKVLEEPATVREEVSFLAEVLGAERLRSALQTVGAPPP